MSVNPRKSYYVQCDHCNQIGPRDEYAEYSAEQQASELGWLKRGVKHYCPACCKTCKSCGGDGGVDSEAFRELGQLCEVCDGLGKIPPPTKIVDLRQAKSDQHMKQDGPS